MKKFLINPIVFLDTFVLSGLTFGILLVYGLFDPSEAGYVLDISVIIFFALFLVATLLFLRSRNRDQFGFVYIEDDGIRSGGVYISWSDVTEIKEVYGFVTVNRSFDRSEYIGRWKYTQSTGIMLSITGRSESGEAPPVITVYRYKTLTRLLSEHRPDLLPKHGKEECGRVLKVSRGNPKIIAISLASSLAVGTVCGLIGGLTRNSIACALLMGLFGFLAIFWFYFGRYLDGFRVYKLTERGILSAHKFIAWQDVSSISISTGKMIFEPFILNCGQIINVNTTYSDFYLDRHSPDCAYIRMTNDVEEIFAKYCKPFRDLQRKLNDRS